MTEDNAITQRSGKVIWQDNLQTGLNHLETEITEIVGVSLFGRTTSRQRSYQKDLEAEITEIGVSLLAGRP